MLRTSKLSQWEIAALESALRNQTHRFEQASALALLKKLQNAKEIKVTTVDSISEL